MIKKPLFSGKSSFKTWLYAIGRNIALDHIRRRSKSSDRPIEDFAAYLSDESDLERSYIKDEQKIRVHKALDKLTDDYRQALWLVYFEELSVKEAAQIMKKSTRQLTNLLYRAKLSLKNELVKEGFVYEEFC